MPDRCTIKTKHGRITACIHLHKPDLKGYKVGGVWECPHCGTRWQKSLNVDRTFSIPVKGSPNKCTYPRYIWHWPAEENPITEPPIEPTGEKQNEHNESI